jgi:N-dimethylarginine dimethylaminohydrolase
VTGALNEYGRIVDVVVSHPADAFRDTARIDREWRDLNFTAAPDLGRALDEFEAFLALVSAESATVRRLPPSESTGLDSLYARDASIVTPRGLLGCRMGKPQRRGEPEAHLAAFASWDIPVVGRIDGPGQIEGGDLVWLDDRTVAVGQGYRTNGEGIRQLRAALPRDVEVVVVPLPHWRGPADVFHLMSIISPVDRDLAVVYSPLMPVPFRELLVERGMSCVEVPDEEFGSMGANVLAIAPRRCVMLDGNPVTRARLEAAGARVDVYAGLEISVKGGGGPTCLTRPIVRE